MPRRVFAFDEPLDAIEGARDPQDPTDVLGGKGAGLNEMTRIGVPVPPGFTLATSVCREFLAEGALPDGIEGEVLAALRAVEAKVGRRLGAVEAPLLVSVRSGAAVSMPGMMDTILNLGLHASTARRARDDIRPSACVGGASGIARLRTP